ncbi:rab-GTPase-TBC domain-containing protein [Chlamydoabsidia padenii]|nr:rab-GTPase-TBC domain-containing protein [Chlamydoabsidia padenii]
MNNTNSPCDVNQEELAKDHQPITTTSPAIKDTIQQQQRERSGTITQRNINSIHYLNDQDKLHDAIQKFDIMTKGDNKGTAVQPQSDDDEEDDDDDDSDYDTTGHYALKSNRSTVTSISSLLSNDTNYDMLLARLGSPLSSGIGTHTSTGTTSIFDTTPTSVINTSSFYTSTSTSAPTSTTSSTLSSSSSSSSSSYTTQEQDIDWEFWSQVISNVDQTIKSNKHFLQHIRQGIPSSLRGTVWPILSKTKNIIKSNSNNVNGINGSSLDNGHQGYYVELLNKDNVYEKAITRDLDSLFAVDQGIGIFTTGASRFRDSLFHLLKAYANYDDHVGYSKGFAFIALPLLLHMPEEEAFCVFVELMNGTYQWKVLYGPPMDGLSRNVFQLDGLVMEHLPKLHHHFGAFGIHPNEYAKPWLTTLFVSVLTSLDCIYAIYDILLAEGTDLLFGFGLALLKINQDKLLALNEPDELINYLLGSKMGDAYKNGPKKMVQDALEFKIQRKQLVKLAKEHQQALSSATSRKRSASIPASSFFSTALHTTNTHDIEVLHMTRQQNKALMENVKQRQTQLEQLSKQHGQSATELIDAKMELARARQSNDDLRQQSFVLKKALDALPAKVEDRLKEHIHALAGKNMGLVDRNSELEYQLANMEGLLMDLKAKFAQSENERDELNLRLSELRELVNLS